jgi:hypothetical protein
VVRREQPEHRGLDRRATHAGELDHLRLRQGRRLKVAPAPDWLDELRFDAAPPYVTMGIRGLDLDRWLIVDDDYEADLAYKARLLATARHTVFGAMDRWDSSGPSTTVLELVGDWLREHGIEPAPPAGDEHPLIEAARLVQDDLALMERIGDQWVLTAGVVCFPSHWTVSDKIGLPLEGIHVPVAHYAEEISERVDRFHDRLVTGRPIWRRNWSVQSTPELHLPAYGYTMVPAPPIQPNGEPMWLRSEYQTLRRLPGLDAILFTIRVQRAPLGVLLDRPDLMRAMLGAITSWDAAKRRYASTGEVLDDLAKWLRDNTVNLGGCT